MACSSNNDAEYLPPGEPYLKIGVLTYFIGQNYGAALQAYATLIALRKLGHDVVFIHYHHPWSMHPSLWAPRSYLGKTLKSSVEKCNRMRLHYQLRRAFGKMEKLFPKTERYYGSNLESLKN